MKAFIEAETGKDTFDQAYGTDKNGKKVDWGDCTEAVSRDYFLDFRKTCPILRDDSG